MNNIHKAATDWFELECSQEQRLFFIDKHQNRHMDTPLHPSLVDTIWLHEIALPWWHTKNEEYQTSVNWPQVMREVTDEHCIAVLYLKEHTSTNIIPQDKECGYCMLGISNVGYGGKLCAYHEKLHGGKLDIPKPIPTEESSEQAAKSTYPLDRISSAKFEQGANWQKEKDSIIIKELLKLNSFLEKGFDFSKYAFPDVIKKELAEIRTTAETFIGTK